MDKKHETADSLCAITSTTLFCFPIPFFSLLNRNWISCKAGVAASSNWCLRTATGKPL